MKATIETKTRPTALSLFFLALRFLLKSLGPIRDLRCCLSVDLFI
ncbi:uncharacterized protein METZ01_LOCUS363432 [marine metagenome]|uniref:Uncharacterized protein n=1 Tax=marine metagenome TaxID=408172 RepID=A0A382SN28_9ZZZZ